jgi:hypothetical protein
MAFIPNYICLKTFSQFVKQNAVKELTKTVLSWVV